MTPQELLDDAGIRLGSYAPGQHSATCPQCSAKRSKAHQKTKCLGVLIDDRGATWRCNHCGWSGPDKGTGNGKAPVIEATYDYSENGTFLFQKVRFPNGHDPRFLIRTRDSNGGW